MSGTSASSVLPPGRYLEKLPTGSYVHVDRLPGSSSAARSAASRAAKKGDLVKLRRGLYYKGKRTRYGVLTPPAEDIALEVLGRTGVGPSGVSAARALNLTTQVPAEAELVTSGPVPEEIRGVRVHKRNNADRRDLNYAEIAVLEVLRDWTFTTESTWDGIVAAVKDRIEGREVRPDKLAKVGRSEPWPAVRERLRDLFSELGLKAAASAVTVR
jgi:hypothetical protein